MLVAGERWYVAQTLHLREGLAEDHLRRQGFGTFLPRLRRTVRHARRTRTVLAPLFPGYLFVVLDPDRNLWRSVNGTIGVATLITEHQRPKPVPKGIVEALQAASDELGATSFEARLTVGQTVQLLTGPFADHLGTVEALDDKGRVRVLLEIMGAMRPVVMAGDGVAPAH